MKRQCRMMKRFQWRRSALLWFGLVATLMVCGLLFVFFTDSERGTFPSVKLQDGRNVEVLGLTHGREHRLGKPDRFKATLHGLVPAPLKKSFGPYFPASFRFNRDGIGLWLMCYDPAQNSYATGWLSKVVAVDEHVSGSGSQAVPKKLEYLFDIVPRK